MATEEEILNEELSSCGEVLIRLDEGNKKNYDLPVKEPSKLKQGYFKRDQNTREEV